MANKPRPCWDPFNYYWGCRNVVLTDSPLLIVIILLTNDRINWLLAMQPYFNNLYVASVTGSHHSLDISSPGTSIARWEKPFIWCANWEHHLFCMSTHCFLFIWQFAKCISSCCLYYFPIYILYASVSLLFIKILPSLWFPVLFRDLIICLL